MRPVLRCRSVRIPSGYIRPLVPWLVAATVAVAHGDPLAALLDSGALAKTTNPVAATYFAEQASRRLLSSRCCRSSLSSRCSRCHPSRHSACR